MILILNMVILIVEATDEGYPPQAIEELIEDLDVGEVNEEKLNEFLTAAKDWWVYGKQALCNYCVRELLCHTRYEDYMEDNLEELREGCKNFRILQAEDEAEIELEIFPEILIQEDMMFAGNYEFLFRRLKSYEISRGWKAFSYKKG